MSELRPRGSSALVLMLALAGCAGAERVFNVSPIPQHRADIVRSATGGLQFVEIHGAPPDGTEAATVVAALRAPAGFRPTRYARVQPGAQSLRLVLEFGATSGGPTSCAAPRGAAQASDADLQAAATLCQGASAVSNATMRAPGVSGPSAPGFEDAAQSLLRAVLTPERPKQFSRLLR